MTRRKVLILCGALGLVAGFVLLLKPQRSEALPPLVASTELSATDILPHLHADLEPGRNYVYCATFQLAWNRLQEDIVGGPILLEDGPPMLEALNERQFRRSELSPESYLVMVGRADEGIAEQFRRELRRRFPSAGWEVPAPSRPDSICAYAYLEKVLRFRKAFKRLEKPLLFKGRDGETPVAAFGVEDYSYADDPKEIWQKQVTIVDYKDENDFVLRLNPVSADDEIVLAKIRPEATLAKTIEAVQRRVHSWSRERSDDFTSLLYWGESLVVPVVELHAEREYKELVGKRLANAVGTGAFISDARQAIHFRLDESGAALRSSALGAIAAGLPPEPRRLVFDRPFLLYMKEREATTPYFAMWVEHPEVLRPVR